MKTLKFGHQGDVLFIKISDTPKKVTAEKHEDYTDDGNLVLHRGEGLGHTHAIKQKYLPFVEVQDLGEQNSVKTLHLNIMHPIEVVHEEHEAIRELDLSQGEWLVKTQRETFRGMVRAVVD